MLNERADHRCVRCGKKLTNLHHIEMGLGPECYKRYKEESSSRRALFDMGKGNRIKDNRSVMLKQQTKKVIKNTVNYYTAAMLLTAKDKLGFGPKRAQKFAEDVQTLFDAIAEGYLSLDDAKKTILEELGIDLK